MNQTNTNKQRQRIVTVDKSKLDAAAFAIREAADEMEGQFDSPLILAFIEQAKLIGYAFDKMSVFLDGGSYEEYIDTIHQAVPNATMALYNAKLASGRALQTLEKAREALRTALPAKPPLETRSIVQALDDLGYYIERDKSDPVMERDNLAGARKDIEAYLAG